MSLALLAGQRSPFERMWRRNTVFDPFPKQLLRPLPLPIVLEEATGEELLPPVQPSPGKLHVEASCALPTLARIPSIFKGTGRRGGLPEDLVRPSLPVVVGTKLTGQSIEILHTRVVYWHIRLISLYYAVVPEERLV